MSGKDENVSRHRETAKAAAKGSNSQLRITFLMYKTWSSLGHAKMKEGITHQGPWPAWEFSSPVEGFHYFKNWFPTVSNTQGRESSLAGVPPFLSSAFFSVPHSCLMLLIWPLICYIDLPCTSYTVSFTLNLFLHILFRPNKPLVTVNLINTPIPILPAELVGLGMPWESWRQNWQFCYFVMSFSLSNHIKQCFSQSFSKLMLRLKHDDPRAPGW